MPASDILSESETNRLIKHGLSFQSVLCSAADLRHKELSALTLFGWSFLQCVSLRYLSASDTVQPLDRSCFTEQSSQ